MLLAAVLLMSASAMAQSSEPVRGDLNGDGKVGMPDIMYLVQKITTGQFPDEDQPTGSTYYWYVGYDQEAYEHPESFKSNMYTTTTNAIPTQYSKSGDNGLDVSGTGTRPNYIIMIIPSTWSVPTIWDSTKQGEIGKTLEKQNVTITGISGVTFNVWSSQGSGISDGQVYIN